MVQTKTSSLVNRLLSKNMSPARIAGFILSNFLGLAIVITALQFYSDSRQIWDADDSFLRSDYMVLNKRVTSEQAMKGIASSFSKGDVSDLEAQPWVKRVAAFDVADYKISASVMQGEKGISTNMFFESIPDDYVDVASSCWGWREGMDEIPIIIPKDYLSLYNFGFAASAGLPRLSEGLMEGIPLRLKLSSSDGKNSAEYYGHVVGFSNRLNTILVPKDFMDWSSNVFGGGAETMPSRVIMEVSSPGDTAIKEYLETHDLEVAGDKSSSSASFLLKIVIGLVLGVGVVITVLSLFILLLSISLLMEKNRSKLHLLIMQGYDLSVVGRPYRIVAVASTVFALVAATGAMLAMRGYYLSALTGLGAGGGNSFMSIGIGALLSVIIIALNLISIRRKVLKAFRI